MQIQEAQRVQITMNPKRLTPRHMIIKVQSFKEKEILKSTKEETRSNIQGRYDKANS